MIRPGSTWSLLFSHFSACTAPSSRKGRHSYMLSVTARETPISNKHIPQQLPGNHSIYSHACCSSINVKFQKLEQNPQRHKSSIYIGTVRQLFGNTQQTGFLTAFQFPEGQGRTPALTMASTDPATSTYSQAPGSPCPLPHPNLSSPYFLKLIHWLYSQWPDSLLTLQHPEFLPI